jgi:hypothetical protein
MGIDKSKAMSLTPRGSKIAEYERNAASTRKPSMLEPARARRHRHKYQRSLNSQLIPERINFAGTFGGP